MPSSDTTTRDLLTREMLTRVFGPQPAASVKPARGTGQPSPAVAEAMRLILAGEPAPLRRSREAASRQAAPAENEPTIKTSARRFVARKSLTFLDTPVGVDGRGRFTQEKSDSLPSPSTDVRELHDVYMSRCGYCTGVIRRRFVRTLRNGRDAVSSLADLTLRNVNVVKTTPNAQLLRMVLAAISRKTMARFKHLVPNRTVAWLDSKPLVALESHNSLLIHGAVTERALERSRAAVTCVVLHTSDVIDRWKCVEDKQHRPAVTLLDDLKTFHLARHELAPRQSTLPSRKTKPQIEQVRKIAITPLKPADTTEVTLRPRPRAEAAPANVVAANAVAAIAKPAAAALSGTAAPIMASATVAQSLLYRAGRVWERPVANPVPAFLERRTRRAKIIAITDVNSGDGKTALVSQLGAMLAAQGDQVLMLDLDYRGALTDACFAPEARQQLRATGRTVVRWLESAGRRGRPLLECMARVSNNLWAVASDESLGVWEARERAAWLVERDPYDVRFRLRGELHGTDICQRFDWILIDCSRRLSTAAINAFTSSDYLLLAGQTQASQVQASSQAQVGQLLGWLARLNVLTGACRGLSMLGVVSVNEEPTGIATTGIAPTGIALPAVDRSTAASPRRDQRWTDGVYYFGNSVPRVAVVKDSIAKEAVAAGVRSRAAAMPMRGIAGNSRTAGSSHAVAGSHIAGLAREMKERIAARGKRR